MSRNKKVAHVLSILSSFLKVLLRGPSVLSEKDEPTRRHHRSWAQTMQRDKTFHLRDRNSARHKVTIFHRRGKSSTEWTDSSLS